jgi:hypothetical protein
LLSKFKLYRYAEKKEAEVGDCKADVGNRRAGWGKLQVECIRPRA